MKKLITVFILCAGFAVSAFAGPHGHHGNWHHRSGNNWVAPAIIGGIIGYELNRQRYYEPPVIVQQPVIIQQQPIYSVTPSANCTVWTETQHADGTITRTRTCNQ
jgi:hypothetical protein